MPFAGPTYTLPAGYAATPSTTILSGSQHNAPFADIEAAFNAVVKRNGDTPMTGNLQMNSNKITGLAAGTAPGDAVRLDQITGEILTANGAAPTLLLVQSGANEPVRQYAVARSGTTITERLRDSAGINPKDVRTITYNDTGATAIDHLIQGVSRLALSATGATVSGLMQSTTLKVRGLIDLNAVNLDTVIQGGWYYAQSNCTNLPYVSGAGWFMDVRELGTTEIIQTLMRHSTDGSQIAQRTTLGGTFTAWRLSSFRGNSGVVAMGTGTQIEYTTIPGIANAVRISVDGVSANGASSEFGLRLRAASVGAILTGYLGDRREIRAATVSGSFGVTDRVALLNMPLAGDVCDGFITMNRRPGGNAWDIESSFTLTGGTAVGASCRSKVDLGANALAGIRLYLSANNFDAGTFTVEWDT